MAEFNPDDYLAQKQAAAAPAFNPDDYLASKESQTPIKDAALAVAGGVGKALGYAGGLARTGILEATGQAEDGDAARALKGNAVTTDEFLNRKGVPEGAHLSDYLPYANKGSGNMFAIEKGGMLDPSARGVAGFVGDVATDPLTYLSGGLSAVAKGGDSALLKKLFLANVEGGGLTAGGKVANAVLNPIEAASRSGATSAYAKAFEKVDGKLDNPSTLAELAQKSGFRGSPQDAVEHFSQMNQNAGKAIGDTLSQASDQGAKVKTMTALQPAIDKAAELRKLGVPEADSVASQIDDRVQQILDTHGETVPVDTANKVKALMNQSTKFAQTGVDALANQSRKAVAAPLNEGIEQGVKDTGSELYDRLMEQKKLYSSTASDTQKKLEQFANQAPQQKGPFGLSKVDAMLAGVGAVGGAHTAGASFLPLAAKKAVDAVQSFEGRTLRGSALQAVGQGSNGLTDEAIRQMVLDEMAKKQMEKNKK